jgi:hypothetical protein
VSLRSKNSHYLRNIRFQTIRTILIIKLYFRVMTGLHDSLPFHYGKANALSALRNVRLVEHEGTILGDKVSEHARKYSTIVALGQKRIRS